MITDIKKIEKFLEDNLSKKRFEHTLAVRNKAVLLAKIHGVDCKKAEIAALLHDVTKELNFNKQLQIMASSDIIADVITLKSPQVLHAITGAIIAKDKFNVIDFDILNAITYHTTARENMSLLEKIVYVADAVSDDRKYKNVEKYRKEAENDIEKVFLEILKMSVKLLVKNNTLIHYDTIKAYNQQLLDFGG